MTEATATLDARHLLDNLKRAECVRQDHHVRTIAVAHIRFGAQPVLMVTDLDQELTLPMDASCDGEFAASLYPPTAITALGSIGGNCIVSCTDGVTQIETSQAFIKGPQDVEPEEFPTFVDFDVKADFAITERALHKALRTVRFAISTEETRYYLNGVFLTQIDGALSVVATDGHRLARYKLDHPYSGPELIIPAPTVKALLKLTKQTSEELITVSIGKLKASFTHKAWTLKTKAIDGKYPDWQRVIPNTKPTISARLTQAHVSRLPKTDDWRHAVISPEEGILQVSDTYGGGSIEMPIKGSGAAFCLASTYLRQLVSVIGNVTLEGSSPDAPFTAKTDDDRILAVQMPMKIPERPSA